LLLHYIIVSALPIINYSLCSQTSSNGQAVSGGQFSTAVSRGSCDRQTSVDSAERRRRGRPRKPITRKPDVVYMTTGCSGGDVNIATSCGSGDVTVATGSTDGNSTVPCVQQHCVVSTQQLQHSAVSAQDDTGVKRAGNCAISEKQHSGVICDLGQRHSADSQQWHSAVSCESAQRHSADTQQQHSAVTGSYETTTTTTVATTTHWTTTTVHHHYHAPTTTTTTTPTARPKFSLSATNTGLCYHDSGSLATASTVMYPGDCAVPMLWLPVNNNDDDGDDDDDKRAIMASSFTVIPLIAAPQPYPCIEPMYVDMATVGMATFGIGMPTTGVGMATDDVGTNNMATANGSMAMAGVGMETAGGVVGDCLMSVDNVDDNDSVAANISVWSSVYHCSGSCLSPLDHPRSAGLTPTLSVCQTLASLDHPYSTTGARDNNELVDDDDDDDDVYGGGSGSVNAVCVCNNVLTQSQYKPVFTAGNSRLCGPHGADESLMLSDNPPQSCQAAAAAADDDDDDDNDDDDAQGAETSTPSRPDVVSSNVPRCPAANTTTCGSSCHAGYCSSVLDSHPVTTTISSNTGSGGITGSQPISANHHHHHQQQHDDDDDDDDDEQPPCVNDHLPESPQPPPPSSSSSAAAAAASAGVDVKSAD